MTKKIDIIITCYNSASTIRKAVCSALGQDYGNVNVIVVDDCSNDSSFDALNGLGVTILRNEHNMGAGMARGIGVRACHGDYVMFLDSDDYLDEDYVSELAEVAERECADIVRGGLTLYNGTRISLGSDTYVGTDKLDAYINEKVKFLNNMLIRRSLFDNVEYCHRRYIEDVPTAIKLMYYADKVCNVETYGYHYLYNERSLTNSASRFKDALFRQLCLCDMVKFFYDVDKSLIVRYGMEEAYYYGLEKLKEHFPTKEEIEEYAQELLELKCFAES